MDNFGFIHEKLDIKILILFVLRRLPAPIDAERLADLVLIDGGINYFEYKQCLSELVTTQQIKETAEGCVITAKGEHDGEALETSIPFSVRAHAEEALAPVVEAMRRDAMILARHEITDNGIMVYLALSDGVGNIFDLKILAGDEAQAKTIETNFKKDAEGFYTRFISALSE